MRDLDEFVQQLLACLRLLVVAMLQCVHYLLLLSQGLFERCALPGEVALSLLQQPLALFQGLGLGSLRASGPFEHLQVAVLLVLQRDITSLQVAGDRGRLVELAYRRT